MAFVRRQLAQSRPSNTNAASVITGIDQQIVVVQLIYVCNSTASAATFRIFHDDDGTTYDQSTAICYDVSVPANTTQVIEAISDLSGGIYLTNSSANLAIRSGTGSALTFTIYGGIFKN